MTWSLHKISLLLLSCCWLTACWASAEAQARSLRGATRKMKVVTFGGSTTYGAGLSSRDLAYSQLLLRTTTLIGELLIDQSDNLAIRASSAVWPSYCLQSMITNAAGPDVAYDIILLEFSVNGITGLNLLLQRLRRRYPFSMILYVDLYSNRRPGWSNCVGSTCRISSVKQNAMIELIRQYGGRIIDLPRPIDPSNYTSVLHWFQHDEHHLNEQGHAYIAQKIIEHLHNHEFSLKSPQLSLGDWLGGDACDSFFETGQSVLEMTGGTMKEFSPRKFAYEVETEGTIHFWTEEQSNAIPTPVLLVYMTKGDPSLYPLLEVRIDGSSDEMSMIDPINPKWADDHVTKTSSVGVIGAGVGEHMIRMKVLPPQKDWPFRLVGIILCSACVSLGHDVTKECRQRGCIQSVND